MPDKGAYSAHQTTCWWERAHCLFPKNSADLHPLCRSRLQVTSDYFAASHLRRLNTLGVRQLANDEQDADSNVATAAAAAAAAGRGSASVVGGCLISSDFIQNVEEDTERTDDVCVGRGKQDDVIIFTTRLFTRLCTWWYLQKLQHQELTHLWSRDLTCIGFNIKNPLTCDHVISPVLASTSRTHSPVRYTTLIRGSTHLSQNARSTRYVGCLVTGFLLSNILRFINSYAIFIPSSFLMYFRHLYLMKCTELFLYVYYWIYCSK